MQLTNITLELIYSHTRDKGIDGMLNFGITDKSLSIEKLKKLITENERIARVERDVCVYRIKAIQGRLLDFLGFEGLSFKTELKAKVPRYDLSGLDRASLETLLSESSELKDFWMKHAERSLKVCTALEVLENYDKLENENE